METAGIEVVKLSAGEYAQACGWLYDAVVPPKEIPAEGWESSLRHLGQKSLETALAGALKRDLGEGAWKWDRKASADISPLCASTVAAFGHLTHCDPDYDVAESLY